jgi:hypothetical protein
MGNPGWKHQDRTKCVSLAPQIHVLNRHHFGLEEQKRLDEALERFAQNFDGTSAGGTPLIETELIELAKSRRIASDETDSAIFLSRAFVVICVAFPVFIIIIAISHYASSALIRWLIQFYLYFVTIGAVSFVGSAFQWKAANALRAWEAINSVSARLSNLKDYDEIVKDWRPPVLYLRPFSEDRSIYASHGAIEAAISPHFSKLGPFVTVQDPQDPIPPQWATRLNFTDEKWKDAVLKLTKISPVISYTVGISLGAGWELEQLIEMQYLRKTICFFPDARRSTGEWIKRKMPDLGPQYRFFKSIGAEAALDSAISTLDLDSFRVLASFPREGDYCVVVAQELAQDGYDLAARLGLYSIFIGDPRSLLTPDVPAYPPFPFRPRDLPGFLHRAMRESW